MGESTKKCDHLKKQDASTVDATKLTALSPDVVSLIPCIILKMMHMWYNVNTKFNLF